MGEREKLVGREELEAEIPENIRWVLEKWDEQKLKPELTNITAQEMKENFKGVFEGKNYFFFDFSGDKLNVAVDNAPGWKARTQPDYGLKEIHLFLSLESYGKDSIIEINPKEIELQLNEDSQNEYEKLLKTKRISFPELLEKAGYIIKRSFRFNPEAATVVAVVPDEDKFIERAKKEYLPFGDETYEGVCGDSGQLIRKLLNSLNPPENIKYIEFSTLGEFSHDTTLVFDKQNGAWGIINSKSPFKEKQFNFTPKDKLEILGVPFVDAETAKKLKEERRRAVFK